MTLQILKKNKILKCKSAGMSVREIARALDVSLGTISNITTSSKLDYTGHELDIRRVAGPKYSVFGFPDVHVPDQDKNALQIALNAQEYLHPDATVIGGDFINCTQFSRHRTKQFKEKQKQCSDYLQTVVRPANQILDKIQQNTSYTFYIIGNHEAWIESWAIDTTQGEALYNMVSIENTLAKDRANFYCLKEEGDALVLQDRWHVIHGWYHNRHAAAKHLEVSNPISVIYHHTHRQQSEARGATWGDEVVSAMSAGCLCEKQPLYKHNKAPTTWVHGFWIAYVGRRSVTAFTVPIFQKRAILPNGKEITA